MELEAHFEGEHTTQSGMFLLACKEAVLTHDMLIKGGMQLCSRCFLCGKEMKQIAIYLSIAKLPVLCDRFSWYERT